MKTIKRPALSGRRALVSYVRRRLRRWRLGGWVAGAHGQVGARGGRVRKKATVIATFRIGQQVPSCSRPDSVTHFVFVGLPRAATLPASRGILPAMVVK